MAKRPRKQSLTRQPREGWPAREDVIGPEGGAWNFASRIAALPDGRFGAPTIGNTEIVAVRSGDGAGVKVNGDPVTLDYLRCTDRDIGIAQQDAWIACRLWVEAGYSNGGSGLNAIFVYGGSSVTTLSEGISLFFGGSNELVASWPTYPGITSAAVQTNAALGVCMRRVGASYELWVNGKLVGSASAGTVTTSANARFTLLGDPSDSYFRRLRGAVVQGFAYDFGECDPQALSENFWGAIYRRRRRFARKAAAAAPSITLQPNGSLLYKPAAGGSDNKLYLTTAGAVAAKTAPGAGDRRISLSGGNWLAN